MDTLLDALQEGRLFELPENDKTHALQFLAHIIEAFPEIPPETDVVGLVMKREQTANTAIGKGWACPHARVPYDEDLMCVVGWSPSGIDYGAPDGKPVSLIVMYLVPDNQRNHYLKEISTLAKALQTYPELEKIPEVQDLDDVRRYLLDLIEVTKSKTGPDVRARMIRLQTKPSIETTLIQDLSNLIVEPVTIVAGPRIKHIVLTQNPGLMEQLESVTGLAEKIESEGVCQAAGWRILRRGAVNYQGGLVTYECLAIKIATNSGQVR
ncbi:MAG TPA: PTS sugar transporter subunit IIA [Syntrophorhabdaceae bacterium]|mgnify:FL=1|nr:PTS sugar transporter subunit IIA [Syntrophorhabdaceae bacterium]HOT42931.1 PTS sugar transporter subunit IIA [Syntrophorhabdaceae bacterium]HQE81055.1 PTS sugar transporter subunit IIA [Syntrophorhabdaceae bacterium]HQK47417.1 PTS sugar transporter subunit IIA [Syntrophorhabdaceae bacterium]